MCAIAIIYPVHSYVPQQVWQQDHVKSIQMTLLLADSRTKRSAAAESVMTL